MHYMNSDSMKQTSEMKMSEWHRGRNVEVWEPTKTSLVQLTQKTDLLPCHETLTFRTSSRICRNTFAKIDYALYTPIKLKLRFISSVEISRCKQLDPGNVNTYGNYRTPHYPIKLQFRLLASFRIHPSIDVNISRQKCINAVIVVLF